VIATAVARRFWSQQKTLDRAARWPSRVEARGEHGGVVAKKRVGWPEKARQIRERGVRERVRGAVNDEQSRRIAPRGGRLRDEARGKLVIEKVGWKRHGKRKE